MTSRFHASRTSRVFVDASDVQAAGPTWRPLLPGGPGSRPSASPFVTVGSSQLNEVRFPHVLNRASTHESCTTETAPDRMQKTLALCRKELVSSAPPRALSLVRCRSRRELEEPRTLLDSAQPGGRAAMTIDKTICYICCEPGADSSDHVIPAGFFPSPRPSTLLTLPAHYSCHNRLDEEDIRNLMASFGRDSSASAVQLWGPDAQGHVRRSFAKKTALRRSLLAGMLPRVEVFSPGGILLGHAPAIRFDTKRVYPSLTKMVRGLYHHHTGRFLPRDVQFSWGLNEMPRTGSRRPGVHWAVRTISPARNVEVRCWLRSSAARRSRVVFPCT